VIINEDGYIVTNHHVIHQADEVEVTLSDNRSFKATVIGTDPTTDLALLRIEADGLTSLPLVNSDEVRVGEWVLAVGAHEPGNWWRCSEQLVGQPYAAGQCGNTFSLSAALNNLL
jgi:hypothetical protein